jgi:hypothetical protein
VAVRQRNGGIQFTHAGVVLIWHRRDAAHVTLLLYAEAVAMKAEDSGAVEAAAFRSARHSQQKRQANSTVVGNALPRTRLASAPSRPRQRSSRASPGAPPAAAARMAAHRAAVRYRAQRGACA